MSVPITVAAVAETHIGLQFEGIRAARLAVGVDPLVCRNSPGEWGAGSLPRRIGLAPLPLRPTFAVS